MKLGWISPDIKPIVGAEVLHLMGLMTVSTALWRFKFSHYSRNRIPITAGAVEVFEIALMHQAALFEPRGRESHPHLAMQAVRMYRG
jgi:hypothetical protein